MTQAIGQPLKPARKWRRRVAMVLIALVSIVVLGYFLVLRHIVRAQILAGLADAGVKNASFELGWVTPWQTELRAVSLGEIDPIRVHRITAEYSPQTLFAGRVNAVRIDGLHVTAQQREGRFELGPLREILARPRGTSDDSQSLPLNSISLTDARVTVGSGAQQVTVALNGTLRQSESGQVDLDLKSAAAGVAFEINGSWDAREGSGQFDLNATKLDAAVVAALVSAALPDLRLSAEGSIHATANLKLPAEGAGVLAATIELEGMRLGQEGSANLQNATGVLHLTADVANGTLGHVVATVNGAGFSSEEYALAVEDLSGRIEIDDLRAPRESLAQSAQVKRMTVGTAELLDGTIDFGLRGWKSIQINQTAWRWLDGTVASKSVNVDPQTGRVEAALKVERIELRSLLELLAKDKAAGDGRVSGELALVIDWPSIQLGDGQLWADGGGNMRIIETAAIDTAVGQSLEAGAGQQVRQNVVEALMDFQYDALRAQLIKEPEEGATAVVKISGRGRTGQRQPIDLDLRVRGLDKLLNAYLGIQHKITGGE